MNFSSYINGESVRNVDLVNWVTLGALDVPTSESAPVTSINGRALSFWLLPYNYFDQVLKFCLALVHAVALLVSPRKYKTSQALHSRSRASSCAPDTGHLGLLESGGSTPVRRE